MTTVTEKHAGRIVQVIGPVIDVEFESGHLPPVYNEFKSVIQQRVVTERVLPIPREDLDEVEAPARVDYLYEPNTAALFRQMLPGHVRIQVWRALLESAAAENAARMTAMDAATKNATDMIDSLTLYMNKVRQAGITREIIEVVSGAQAL